MEASVKRTGRNKTSFRGLWLRVSQFPLGFVLALSGIYVASLGQGLCRAFPMSSRKQWIEKYANLNGNLFHLLLPIGAIFGAITNSFCLNRLGWNKTIAIGACNALFAMMLLIVCSDTVAAWPLQLGLFLLGAACGVVSHAAPTYLHDVSHHKSRGKIVSGHPAVVAIGFSLSLMIGPSVSRNVLTCLSVFPFVLGALLQALSPVSPLWLAENDRPQEEIRTALQQLHGPRIFAEKKLQLLSSRGEQTVPNTVRPASVAKPLAISIGLMLLQQLSGVSGLKSLFYNDDRISYNAVTVFCLTHIVVSMLASFLHDRLSRKLLLFISLGIELLGLIILAVSWNSPKLSSLSAEHSTPLMIFGVSIFIGGYSLGAGSVPWVMVNELLPGRAKWLATAASTATSWLFDTVVPEIFTVLLNTIGGPQTFAIFSVFVVISFAFVHIFVPETSGLTVEELENRFRHLYDSAFIAMNQMPQSGSSNTEDQYRLESRLPTNKNP